MPSLEAQRCRRVHYCRATTTADSKAFQYGLQPLGVHSRGYYIFIVARSDASHLGPLLWHCTTLTGFELCLL